MPEKFLNRLESNEQFSEIEVLDRDSFREYLYPQGFLVDDPRLEDQNHGGAFKYFRPSDTLVSFADKMRGTENPEYKFFVLSKKADMVVGIAELEVGEGRTNSYWVKFVDVDPEFQGKGYGRKLVEGIFEFAKEKNITLVGSSRTDMGEERMGHIFEELSQETGVTYIPAIDDRHV